ncbi:site-specific integrase [Microbulbifer elongatus]|uniref:site-specific integrase n=1 Tax=Microbulbifer elongatus TaxID=86173 RepID=UPI001CFE1588|nr:site-specific integrase [Microbulbifer elongatus]
MSAKVLDPRMYRAIQAIRPDLLCNPIPDGTKIHSSDLHALAYGLMATVEAGEVDRLFTQFYEYLESLGAKCLFLTEKVRVAAIRRSRSILNVDVIDISNRIEVLDSSFYASLVDDEKSIEWSCGRILYSLIRFGGLLRSDLLAGVIQMLKAPPKMIGDHIWFEIFTDKDSDPYIWSPDPLSRVLLYKWYKEGAHNVFANSVQSTTKKWFPFIRRFFIKQELVWRKRGLTQTKLLVGQRAYLAVNAPAVIAHCAFGLHKIHTLKSSCYLRMLTKKVPPLPDDKDSDLKQSKPNEKLPNLRAPIGKSGLGKKNQEFLKEVGKVLRGNGQRGAKAREIHELIEEYRDSCSDLTRYLSHWVAARLIAKNRWGNRYSGSTAYTALRKIARRLLMAFGAESPFDMSLEAVAERYFEVIDMSDTQSLRQSVTKFLRQFHEYLEDDWGISSLGDEAPWVGLTASNAVVDAKIVLPHEYAAAIDYYKHCSETSKNQEKLLYEARRLVLTLGFRTGLRRREIHLLRIRDVTTKGRQEIVIRSYLDRNLKSRAAIRRIPIDVLLNENELSLMNKWLEFRRSHRAPSDDYLFAIPDSGGPYLQDRVIFNHIHWVLRHFTGDETTRFHNLRHSCATLSFWSWMRPRYKQNGTTHCDLHHLPVEQTSAQRRRVLDVEVGHEPSRKTLYALASMIGHSGPAMTLEHYIHCIDWMLECEMDRLTPVLTKKALANLAGVSVRQIENLSKGGQLTAKVISKRIARKYQSIARHPDVSTWNKPSEVFPKRNGYCLPPESLFSLGIWTAVQKFFIHGATIKALVVEFGIEENVIEAAIDRAR